MINTTPSTTEQTVVVATVSTVPTIKDKLLAQCEKNKKQFIKYVGEPFYEVIVLMVQDGDIVTEEKLREMFDVSEILYVNELVSHE